MATLCSNWPSGWSWSGGLQISSRLSHNHNLPVFKVPTNECSKRILRLHRKLSHSHFQGCSVLLERTWSKIRKKQKTKTYRTNVLSKNSWACNWKAVSHLLIPVWAPAAGLWAFTSCHSFVSERAERCVGLIKIQFPPQVALKALTSFAWILRLTYFLDGDILYDGSD